MKFKLDENLPPSAVKIFKAHGFDAMSVRDEGLTGCNDDRLVSVCVKEERTLVTLDLDFSDIRKYQPAELNGIIIIRSYKQSRDYTLEILEKIMPFLKTEDVTGKLVIVEEDRIRIR